MAGTECRTNAISNQHTLSVCTASGKISCGWSHQQPAFLSATQCLKEAWEVKRACEVARLAYAGMAVRCKGRSGSGAVDRQSGAREGAAAIHLMFCFVGATGCSGVQHRCSWCGLYNEHCVSTSRVLFPMDGGLAKCSRLAVWRCYGLWCCYGKGALHAICVGVSRALVPISLFRSDPVAAACCVVVVPARPVL